MLTFSSNKINIECEHTNCVRGGGKLNKQFIAKRLIKLRGPRSREEVAEAIGISVSALQMYENSQRVPRDDIKIKIARYYKRDVQQIFYQ